MPPTDSSTIPVELVGRVLARLDTLHGELDAAANPHRMALRHLGLTDAFSGARTPYHQDAFAVWSDLRRRNSSDWESAHHLAIMHHARAFDLEFGAHPEESDVDWAAAMELWHRLWQADGFWEGKAASTASRIPPGVWRSLREQLPTLLLTLHYDIAFDAAQARVHRAKYHLGLVHAAPYPSDAKEAVQRDAYTRFISVVPPAVWQFQETNPETIKVGTDRIEAFLALDPGCVPALEDAVRLQARLLSAWNTDLGAMGDDKRKRKQLLQTVRAAADRWRPYFDQLAGVRQLDEEVRQKLGRWYRLMGDVHCALDQEETSIGFYAQGVKSTLPEDDEHRRCRNEVVETRALVARELAGGKKPNAKSYCDDVRRSPDLTIKAHFLLANAYAVLEEFDAAEAVCERGLSIEPQVNDVEEIEEQARGHQHLEELLSHVRQGRSIRQAKELLDKAMELIKADREPDALPLLNRAAILAPELAMVYFVRCQCHITLLDPDEAREDLVAFRRLVDSKEGKQAAAKLQEPLDQLAEQIRKFGREGLKWRRLAIEAANAEQFERAAELFRKAIEQCPGPGEQELQHGLATVLTNHAITKVNAAMGDGSLLRTAKKAACREALSLLQDAVFLNPGSPQIRKAMADLNGVIAQLDAPPGAAGTPDLVTEAFNFPGGEALRSRFLEAVASGRQDEAQRLLIEAVQKRFK